MKTRFLPIAARVLTVALVALVGLMGAAQAASMDPAFGTGEPQRSQLRHEYSLRMSFSDTKGAVVTHVRVVIADLQGHLVLTTTTPGPWLFVRLPAGDYQVKATRPNGDMRVTEVHIDKTGQTRADLTL